MVISVPYLCMQVPAITAARMSTFICRPAVSELITDMARSHTSLTPDSAAIMAMRLLRTGSPAVDAVEMAIKVLEDRKITNAGYGSNLCLDGVVECDATIVDEKGRSGAVGAVCREP